MGSTLGLGTILQKDELFTTRDAEKIWQKYCGFLDLAIGDFMLMQENLLDEQIELAAGSELGRKVMRGRRPKGIDDFRRNVPLTTYADYEPYLGQKSEEVLPEKPCIWAHTSSRTGLVKWAPYTRETVSRLANDTLAALVLSSATKKGEVRLHEGAKVVLALPSVSNTTGIMALAAAQRLAYQAIPPLEVAEQMEFEQRIHGAFRIALHTGIDYAGSIAVVLAEIGESFGRLGSSARFSLPSWHPLAVLRILKAVARSKALKRPVLPKDIWKVKGLVCFGTDTAIYRERINYYWGVQPLDVYVSTEACCVAMQCWNKKDMTFVPYSNFYEFIPEEGLVGRSREDQASHPSTVLLDEVQEGKSYEIVVTNFHGGPFLRYRMGDLVRITALKDTETGVNLPQMTFRRRADDVIDIVE